MILGMELAMLVIGFLALVRGRLTITPTKVVEGAPARLLGLIAMAPLPLVLLVGVAVAVSQGPNADPEKFAEDNRWTLIAIEAAIVIGTAIVVFGIGSTLATDPTQVVRRKRVSDDEGYDESDERRSWER